MPLTYSRTALVDLHSNELKVSRKCRKSIFKLKLWQPGSERLGPLTSPRKNKVIKDSTGTNVCLLNARSINNRKFYIFLLMHHSLQKVSGSLIQNES